MFYTWGNVAGSALRPPLCRYLAAGIDRIGKMKKRNQTIKRDQRALL